jgi:hypothetical protein
MFPCTADWRLEKVDDFAFGYFLEVNHTNHIFPDRSPMLPVPCSLLQAALLAAGLCSSVRVRGIAMAIGPR